MEIEQRKWMAESGWAPPKPSIPGDAIQLVLVFGSRRILSERTLFPDIKKVYPDALLFGCSTAGEIMDTQVYDNSLVTTAIHFEDTGLQTAEINLNQVGGDSFQAGAALAQSLEKTGLVHVIVLSEGISVNASSLTRGLIKYLPDKVKITGGLAGDGDRFKETWVMRDASKAERGLISVLGLYGNRIKVGYGSVGGWDPFGPERLVTRSRENVLYELDGRSALGLYKEYLGEHAGSLPSSGLLFPLDVRINENTPPVVRTILRINEEEQSLIFAGDIPEGAYARLMKANFDRLIEGSAAAARVSWESPGNTPPDLAILISCVGRKLILKQRTEEEIEAVRNVFGEKTAITGFYSYGEICPRTRDTTPELHNQTMTITTLLEK